MNKKDFIKHTLVDNKNEFKFYFPAGEQTLQEVRKKIAQKLNKPEQEIANILNEITISTKKISNEIKQAIAPIFIKHTLVDNKFVLAYPSVVLTLYTSLIDKLKVVMSKEELERFKNIIIRVTDERIKEIK